MPSSGASSADERQEGDDRRADDDARIAQRAMRAMPAGALRARRLGELGGQGLDAQ